MSAWANKRAIDIVEARYVTQEFFIDLDEEARATQQGRREATLSALLTQPQAWVDWSHTLRPGDLVRVVGAGMDVMLNARSVMKGSGCVMEVYGERSRLGTPLGDAIAKAELAVRAEERAVLEAQLNGIAANGSAAS